MPSSTLEEFVVRHREEIVAMCTRKMVTLGHDDVDATRFHALLDELSQALRHSDPRRKSAVAALHGVDRQRSGDAIQDISVEIGLLCDSITELAERDGLAFRAGEFRALNAFLDCAVSSAIEAFTRREHEEEASALTERIGKVAHELRNALTAVKMAFSMITSAKVGVHGATASILERGLTRMESVIERMVLLARTRATEPRLETFDVNGLLEELRDGALLERGITVGVETATHVRVFADKHLLMSALTNLVQNAVKFTHDGGRVALRASVDDGRVTFSVQDECGGLPPNAGDVLFRPFSQARADERGLGLGLSIAREAIETQGGTIDVHDVPQRGCIFSVHVPLAH